MKKFKMLFAVALSLCIAVVMLAACACTPSDDEEKDDPGKTSYTVTFDLNYDGAPAADKVTVESGSAVAEPSDPVREGYKFGGWYTDAACTTEADFELAVTEDVTYYAAWEKTVAVVTFVFNDGTDKTETKEVNIGGTVAQPADPERDGYLFTSWYSDESMTKEYDFSAVVGGDLTLYAGWEEVSETGDVLTVTFMWNYDGAPNGGVANETKVNYNSKPREYNAVRTDYYLAGWYTDAACTEKFDFGARLTKSVTLYARWMDIYTFEAEYVDFTGMSGNGYSGSMSGVGLIVKQKEDQANMGASNGYYAGWSYKEGYTLTFNIESDTAVDDAVLVLRLSAEFYDMTYTDESYLVQVNGTNLKYGSISITNVPAQGSKQWKPFANFTISTSVSLVEGANTIKLIVNNSDRLGDSGTMYSTAPLVDCMYVYTDAGLTWDPLTENLEGKVS